MRCLAVAVAVLVTNPASAIECLHAKPRAGHWASWRLIDGKRCWYEGHRHLAKSRLTWLAPRTFRAPAEAEAVRLVPVPLVRPTDTFEDRWHGQ